MNNKEWIKLIEKKRVDLVAAGVKAYKDAWDNKHLRFIVEMDEDGSIHTWYDIAGGNSILMSSFEGTSIGIAEFCHQYNEIDVTEEAFREKAIELKKEDKIAEIEEQVQELDDSFMTVVWENPDKYSEVLAAVEQDEIEFDISEYAECQTEEIINQLIKRLTSW